MKSIRYFLFLILICLSIFCLVFLFRIFIFGNRNARVEQHALEFTELARSWDEGIPLGNGMLGALIWQKGDHLRFSLDRADLWDLRPMENLSKPEFSFKWVQEQVKNKTYKNVQDLFDVPYNQLPAPSKIPGAAIEFDTRQLGRVTGVDLTLSDALCEVEWENGAEMESFVDASGQEGWFQFSGIPENFAPVIVPPVYRKDSTGKAENALTGQDLQRLGYDQGTVTPEPGKLVYRQKGWNGFEYEVAVAWKHSGKSLTGSWSITSSFSGEEGQKPASLIVSDQMTTSSFQKAFRSHEKWWNYFWSRSSVSIPDTVLEKQWYLEQYKFGSAARADAPPISLQAVWTADNGKLPPWKGDFHHDLNTQLSYWPSYSGNHLNLEEGFINWL